MSSFINLKKRNGECQHVIAVGSQLCAAGTVSANVFLSCVEVSEWSWPSAWQVRDGHGGGDCKLHEVRALPALAQTGPRLAPRLVPSEC